MKINLNDFIKEEDFLENFEYIETKWLIFKKKQVKTLCYERISLKKLLILGSKYFNDKGEELWEVEFKKKEMVNDLYKIFKEDARNFWLKKGYLKQQPVEHLRLMIGIISRELLFKDEKKKKKMLVAKSPLERFLDSL